ncbi:MAG: tetratricopeptide repeat protein [Candidatus Zixiibacteriota bacterium]
MDQIYLWILAAAVVIIVIVFLVVRFKREKIKPAQLLYIDGLKALLADDVNLAFQKLKQVVSQDTKNVDAYLKLGDIFRKKKIYDKALRIHRELALRRSLSTEEQLDIKKSLALDYMESGNHSQAAAILNEILKLNERDPWAIQLLLSEYEQTGKWDEAFELRSKLFKHKKEKDRSILALYKVYKGKELASQGDYHKARVAYKEGLNYDDMCVPAYIFLGDAYYSEQRLDEAVNYWKKLLQMVPEAGYLVFNKLEKTLYELGSFGEISEIYEQIYKENPKDFHALFALASLDEKKGRSDEAQLKYNQILDIDPSFLPARLSLIRVYQEQNEIEKAKEMVDKLFENLPAKVEYFTCEKCGFSSSEPLWRCPSCREWNSFNI